MGLSRISALAAAAISWPTGSGSVTSASSRRSRHSGVRPSAEISVTAALRRSRIAAWCSGPAALWAASSRCSASNCSSRTAILGISCAPAARSSRVTCPRASVVVIAGRRLVIRKPSRTSSATIRVPLSPVPGNAEDNRSASTLIWTGAWLASRTARTAGESRITCRSGPAGTSHFPACSTASDENTTVRRPASGAHASQRSMTDSSHAASHRAAARCASPKRTNAGPPNLAPATPAKSPNGVGRPAARNWYRARATAADSTCLAGTSRPAAMRSARSASDGLAHATASRSTGSSHAFTSHFRSPSPSAGSGHGTKAESSDRAAARSRRTSPP